ncbi:MAG: ABC transporter ATP-binding protein [Thermaerobacter sp.]|nr:ABC transporter ATP-binding protein [Thermaerobacter sp.]
MASVYVDGVWKRFLLRKDRPDSVGQLLVRMIPGRNRRPKGEAFWALRDVSLAMPAGVSYGIVGSNGSGKSTLLKVLTRTMTPTQGSVRVAGRVSALIELGAGFHPDFTGRENVYLNASILGIDRVTVERKMEEIIDFADIRPFIDTPVKYYSTGMHARLGFAVATSMEPEILIVDEVLSVGDEAFQQRCMDRIFRMKRQGTSMLLVSHDLSAIERLMDQALWIDQGVMKMNGRPRDVVHAYRESLVAAPETSVEEMPAGAGPLQLVRAVAAALNNASDTVVSGEALEVAIDVQHEGVAQKAHLSFTLRRPDGLEIVSLSTFRDAAPIELKTGSNTFKAVIRELPLATGRYEVDAALHSAEGRLLQEWKSAAEFTVQSMERTASLMVLPHEWKVG